MRNIYVLRSKNVYHSPMYGKVNTCIVVAMDAENASDIASRIRLNACGGHVEWGEPIYIGTDGPSHGTMFIGYGRLE